MNTDLPRRPEPPGSGAESGRTGGAADRATGSLVPGAVALVLAALVAAASRGPPVWRSLPDQPAPGAGSLANLAGPVFGIVTAVAVILVVRYTISSRRRAVRPGWVAVRRPLAIAGFAAAVLLLAVLTRGGQTEEATRTGGALQMEWFPGLGLANDPEAPPDAAGSAELVPQESQTSGTAAKRSLLELILMLLAALLAAALVSFAVWSWLRRRPAGPGHLADEHGVNTDAEPPLGTDALLGSIDAMLASPDPRTAILGAYARLLTGLAACGLERREFEAPREHLQRALTGLRVHPQPLRQLIGLFEIARFSTLPLTEAHRERALEALRAGVDDISVVPAPRPPVSGARPVGAVP